MKRRFFAQEFDGLNTASAAHLIGNSEFQLAENVSYAEIGAAAPLGNDRDLWESGSDPQNLTHVRYGGEDHLIAVAGGDVYEDGTVVSGLTGTGDSPTIMSDGDRIYILDGDGNRVYDGTNVRDHGAPQKPSDAKIDALAFASPGLDISATASTSPTTIDLIYPHGLSDGDEVEFSGMVGGTWDTIEGQIFTVTVVDSDTFTIDLDSSGFGVLTEGVVVPAGPVVGMTYRYAVSTVVVMSDGQEIESSLVELWYTSGTSYTTKNGIIPQTGEVINISVDLDSNPLTGYVSPTTGHDYKMIVYRTKGNGDTFYVMKEVASGEMSSYRYNFDDNVIDSELGAAWLYDADSNDTPPVGTMAVICQQQMFVAGVEEYPSRLYFSGIGRYDYFAPSDYIECRDAITALAEMGDRVAVFSDAGIGVYIPDETIGQYKRSLSPVGVENKEAVISTAIGVIFGRDDGVWLFDGNSAQRINESISDNWPDGPWRLAYMTNRLVCVNGTHTYLMDLGGGKMRWTVVTETYPQYVSAAHDGSQLYGLFSDGAVRELFTTGVRDMKVRSRNWGGGGSWRAMWATIDGDAAQDFTVRVRDSSGGVYEAVLDNRSGRDRYRISVPRSIRGDYISVEVQGRVTLYQIELVVD